MLKKIFCSNFGFLSLYLLYFFLQYLKRQNFWYKISEYWAKTDIYRIILDSCLVDSCQNWVSGVVLQLVSLFIVFPPTESTQHSELTIQKSFIIFQACILVLRRNLSNPLNQWPAPVGPREPGITSVRSHRNNKHTDAPRDYSTQG